MKERKKKEAAHELGALLFEWAQAVQECDPAAAEKLRQAKRAALAAVGLDEYLPSKDQ